MFVYSAGKLIAEYSTATPQSNPTTSWTVTDQLGSPRLIVNSLGAVVSRRDFMPFGEELDADQIYRKTDHKYGQTDSVRQKFTGYQSDTETGLDFAEARMYQNLHGRFTAVDPLLASGKSVNPQTFNRYVYVANNPLLYTDPSGLQMGDVNRPVYYTEIEPGRYAFSSRSGYSSKSGLTYDKRWTGGKKRITGIDGYEYTVWAGGWRQHGLDRTAPARGRSGRNMTPNAGTDNALLRT